MESKKIENMNNEMDNSKENGITLNDIIILKNLVNISARRGAFSVEEFKEIGEIYEKVDNFCKYQTKMLEEVGESDVESKKI
tara:strand:+ start:300 stop:545 length:246 start_codon:yes stop_codon:yes gene_type:complete